MGFGKMINLDHISQPSNHLTFCKNFVFWVFMVSLLSIGVIFDIFTMVIFLLTGNNFYVVLYN